MTLAKTVKIVSYGYKRILGEGFVPYAILELHGNKWNKEFSSKSEFDDFIVSNFEKLDREQEGFDLCVFESILSKMFGSRNWKEGIVDESYNAQNWGEINSYGGQKKHEDIGIEVFGTSSYGNADYGYSGSIMFKFI